MASQKGNIPAHQLPVVCGKAQVGWVPGLLPRHLALGLFHTKGNTFQGKSQPWKSSNWKGSKLTLEYNYESIIMARHPTSLDNRYPLDLAESGGRGNGSCDESVGI